MCLDNVSFLRLSMCENTDYKSNCYDSLEELYDLYDKVRYAVILVENFDKERKMYIAPINQLRSALDHMFKAVHYAKNQKQSAYEIKEAKEHLDRAGYDALELLAGNLGTTIIEKVSQYDNKTLTSVFSDYFTKIKPKITDIQNTVAQLRSEKKIDSEKSFSAYFDQITELIDLDKRVDVMIPSLEEFKQKEEETMRKEEEAKKKDKYKEWIIGTLSAIVSAIISGLVVYFITTC